MLLDLFILLWELKTGLEKIFISATGLSSRCIYSAAQSAPCIVLNYKTDQFLKERFPGHLKKKLLHWTHCKTVIM